MEKEDARKLSPEQQKEKRKIALRMRMNGHEFAEIGRTVGVHPRTVQYWWSRYQAEGVNQRAKLTRQPGISALNFDHPG